jgi:hypothetical protein
MLCQMCWILFILEFLKIFKSSAGKISVINLKTIKLPDNAFPIINSRPVYEKKT